MGSKKEEATVSQCLKTLQKGLIFSPFIVDSFKFSVKIIKDQKAETNHQRFEK